MSARGLRFCVALPVAFAFCVSSRPARADVTKEQCIDADAKAQDFRRQGKLSSAREQLRACSSPSCPAIISEDCTQRLDELEKAQPTIVFDAKDASGRDIVAVKVTMDGRPVTDRLDGSPMQVDPGEHAFVFTTADQASVTQTFVIKYGEKDHHERIALGAAPGQPASPQAAPVAVPSASPATTTVAPPPEPEAPGHGMGTQKILGLVAGGTGVVAVGLGAVFGVMTMSAASAQQSDCPSSTNCPRPSQAATDHSNGQTDRTISTIGFIAGGVLLAGGAALFFTAGHPSDSPAASVAVAPSVGPGGGGLLFTGRF
jgi:hypothetical protein